MGRGRAGERIRESKSLLKFSINNSKDKYSARNEPTPWTRRNSPAGASERDGKRRDQDGRNCNNAKQKDGGERDPEHERLADLGGARRGSGKGTNQRQRFTRSTFWESIPGTTPAARGCQTTYVQMSKKSTKITIIQTEQCRWKGQMTAARRGWMRMNYDETYRGERFRRTTHKQSWRGDWIICTRQSLIKFDFQLDPL